MKILDSENLPFQKRDSWKIFNQIALRYDLLNHLLSLGLDISWRQKLLHYFPEKEKIQMLDLATGTADVVIMAAQKCSRIEKAIGIDLAEEMLAIGRQKISQAHLDQRIKLQQGDAMQIPFENERFELVTMAFGIRNVPNPIITLKEIYRVTKRGGKALILEFSLPGNFFLYLFHLFYLRLLVPLIGGLVSGNFKAYFYLNRTIETFPYGERFCRMVQQVGFKKVQAHPLLGGIATIYEGER
ncbi:MAG: bifunctional demethylmenaquinone methyltransferase/2-methoxy-6-polyprenyl-1,4-benzoquinol methylase UbiE [Candidatus Omnitrophica bacterium]|nr:bifunctional demethylmenaquinone methyltransferase/2-methoxy-6-polyprenyl-1,4-benzoquinol methylase UbiE [Candidatus Omnitrophota bacterium]